MLNKINKEEYNKNGLVVINKVFDKDEINEIRLAIKEVKLNKDVKVIFEDDNSTIRSIMSYHNKNEVLKKYTRHKKVINCANSLIGTDIYVSQSKINLKASKHGKKWDYHRGFTFWRFLDGIKTPNMLTAMICITKQTIENGCVYYLEGSHKDVNEQDILEESLIVGGRKDDTSSTLSIQIKESFLKSYKLIYKKKYIKADIGDLILMHPCLLHASDANKSKISRDLMVTVYNTIQNIPTKKNREAYLSERDYSIVG